MNLKNYIGKTFRHPMVGRFVCEGAALFSDHTQARLTPDGNVWLLAPECKRIRIVKRKKSQVLVYALEHISEEGCLECINENDSLKLRIHYENVAKAALEKYRRKK